MIKKILDVIQYFVFGGVIAIVLYFYVVAPHRVDGVSMMTNFLNNDLIFVYKLSYTLGADPRPGDVVVFRYSENSNYIKRVIGVPGDKVQLRDGHFYVNNKLMDETGYLRKGLYTDGGNFLSNNGRPITVPPEQYFVSGDNRPHSSDSRAFGPVKKSAIEGKVFVIWFPFKRLHLIGRG